jgi:hypothetical protein
MAIWYMLWPFGNLVAIWYIFPCFGTLNKEKSGNPVADYLFVLDSNFPNLLDLNIKSAIEKACCQMEVFKRLDQNSFLLTVFSIVISTSKSKVIKSSNQCN